MVKRRGANIYSLDNKGKFLDIASKIDLTQHSFLSEMFYL